MVQTRDCSKPTIPKAFFDNIKRDIKMAHLKFGEKKKPACIYLRVVFYDSENSYVVKQISLNVPNTSSRFQCPCQMQAKQRIMWNLGLINNNIIIQ